MVENSVKVSMHASERLNERFDIISTEVQQNIAERAWKNGKTYRDYSGKAGRYLYDIQTRYSQSGCIVKAYANKIFIFDMRGILCTAYPESDKFKHLKNKTSGYRKMSCFYEEEYCGYRALA